MHVRKADSRGWGGDRVGVAVEKGEEKTCE